MPNISVDCKKRAWRAVRQVSQNQCLSERIIAYIKCTCWDLWVAEEVPEMPCSILSRLNIYLARR
jgi:hypothetical protein